MRSLILFATSICWALSRFFLSLYFHTSCHVIPSHSILPQHETCMRQYTNTRTLDCEIGDVLVVQSFPTQLLVTLFECLWQAKKKNKAKLFSTPLRHSQRQHCRLLNCYCVEYTNITIKRFRRKAITLSAIGEWHCDFIQFYHWLVVFVVVSIVDDVTFLNEEKSRAQSIALQMRTLNVANKILLTL